MPAPATAREHRFISLRQLFQSEEALDRHEDPLVRLGALYCLSRQPDQDTVKKRLFELLATANRQHPDADNPEALVFFLHVAMLLAQQGAFEGVQWILHQALHATSREQRWLAETALRNCAHFPLAVLVVQAIDLDAPEVASGRLEPLMRYSEDDFVAFSEASVEAQGQALAGLAGHIEVLRQWPRRAGRELALGTVISRPLAADAGFRYTGFAAVDGTNARPLVIPYESGVVNRDYRNLPQSVWQLLGQPGRQTLLVFNTDSSHEAQALYVLPFAKLPEGELEALIARMAAGCDGAEIGVVVEQWSTSHDKGRYRLITPGGRAFVQAYRAELQEFGNCFLIHELNERPFWLRQYRLANPGVAKVIHSFIRNTALDLAVEVNQYRLATRSGDTVNKPGGLPADLVYVAEQTDRGRFVFKLPGSPWQPADRSRVLQIFFDRTPQAFGVVLETFEWDDGGLRARAVRATDGNQKLKPVDRDIPPGTVVYWETNEKGDTFANLLLDQRIEGGCPHCFGAQYRLCVQCDGHGRVTCPECGGSRRVSCQRCSGNRQEPCGRCYGKGKLEFKCNGCSGTGTWSGECRNCGGTGSYSGACKICNGTGRYADTGRTCVKCSGHGSFTATCRKCSGSGTVSGPCKRCNSQGGWSEECKTCHGTGRWECGTCHGRGDVFCSCEYGTITCPACDGNRISVCECRGQWTGTIVPV